eukprot:74802-Rhodomonas_salina.1
MGRRETRTLFRSCQASSVMLMGMRLSLIKAKRYLLGHTWADSRRLRSSGLSLTHRMMLRRQDDEMVTGCGGDMTVWYAREQRSNSVCAVDSSPCSSSQTAFVLCAGSCILFISALYVSPTLECARPGANSLIV